MSSHHFNPLDTLLSQHGLEKTYDILINEYKLVVKKSENQPYVLLDYDQLNSPRKHPVVDHCRGLILTQDLKTIVCRPFKRFYNLGEHPEVEKDFDWSNCKIPEKADGSLIKVWFNSHANRWEIATRGSLFGEHQLPWAVNPNRNTTFRDLFLRAADLNEEQFESGFREYGSPELTYLFELCTRENLVITPYLEPQIVSLSVIENASGAEVPELHENSIKALFKNSKAFRYPALHQASSAAEVKDLVNALPGLQEGVVVCDSQNRRLKVKSTKYIIAHLAKSEGGLSPKRAVMLAIDGDVPEFLSYFPEYESYLAPYAKHVRQCLNYIDQRWSEIKGIEDKREMAMLIKDDPLKSIFFELKKGRTLKDILDSLTENSKLSFFGNLEKTPI